MRTHAIGEHVRPGGAPVRDGIYRVVGNDDERITLLRVGDGDGNRRHTGEVISISRDTFETFDPAEPPEPTRGALAWSVSTLGTLYWSTWAFGEELFDHPAPTSLVLGVLVLGLVADRFDLLSEPIEAGLIVLGSLGLAYIGGGLLGRRRG